MNRRKFVQWSAGAALATRTSLKARGHDDQKARIGFIGVGGRGTGLLRHLLTLPDVEVPAITDIKKENLRNAQSLVEKSGRIRPEGYFKNETIYRKMVARDDIDGVIIATPWRLHIPMSIDALKAGKYAGSEVGAASSVQECWDLVRTAEETGAHCMLLSNTCYRRDVMAVLNMARQGLFGELIHCQGGYQHDLRKRIVRGKTTGITLDTGGDYRTRQNQMRNGDLYPVHGLGPIAKILNVNRGNRFLSLTSMATKSRGLHHWAKNNLESGHSMRDTEWAHGDIISTLIQCSNGESIVLTHDTNLPRPYSLMYRVQGTRGLWMYDSESIYIEGRSPHHKWEPFKKYQKEFEHPVWKQFLSEKTQGGHGGTDLLELREFVSCVKNKKEPPIDVYDMAAWMAVTPLSERSIALGSNSVEFPDFTNGRWMYARPSFGVTQ